MLTKIESQEDWDAASVWLDHLLRMCSEDEFITTLPPAIVDGVAKEIEPLMAMMSAWDRQQEENMSPEAKAEQTAAYDAEFRAEARRQSSLAANSPHAEDDQAFVDSISILNDDDFNDKF